MAIRRQVQRSRRKSLWLFLDVVLDSLSTASSLLSASLNAAALALRPFTIVRTYVEILLESDQAATPEAQFGAFGIAVVSDQAIAVGITAVPTPGSDLGLSLWFAHQLCFGQHNMQTDRTNPAAQYSVDSKAMRKVEVGSDVAIVVENVSAIGFKMTTGGRILIKTN